MLSSLPLLVVGILCSPDSLLVPEGRIRVDADEVTHTVTRYMTGACIEDVNHEIYGGLYSQMVFGESFQEPTPAAAAGAPAGISGMWSGTSSGGATGTYALETVQPFVGIQSQRITFVEGEGEFGIENRGLNRWGMAYVAGRPYEGCLWARAEQPVDVFVALESADGQKRYGETRVRCEGREWQRLDFTLSPEEAETNGRFSIRLKAPGSVVLGYAFLQPGPWGRFKELPVRKDVAEGLIEQGLTVLRYGGSMVNNDEYRWKKMIGPRDLRPPYKGTWYPYSTNGWGIVDFVRFCEAAGFLAVPAFNMGESPEDMADFVEYMNGPAESPWGRKRAEDGHAEPYRLKHIQLGNEEKVDEAYLRRFQPLAEAVWSADPDIIVVVGDFMYTETFSDPVKFSGNPSGITSLAAHREILRLGKAHSRPVWFDVHVVNDRPDQPDVAPVESFMRGLKAVADGADFKVCVFEENSNNHSMSRALGHAHAINALQRLGDRVPILCAANCLQPYRQNDNGWDQGMLFLTPSQVWGQPPYYVTQMIADNYLPQCLRADWVGCAGLLDVTARKSEDGRVLVLQVLNMSDRAVPAGIFVEGFTPTSPVARVTRISGALDEVNTPEDPRHIVPVREDWPHSMDSGASAYRFPPRSFTLLRYH